MQSVKFTEEEDAIILKAVANAVRGKRWVALMSLTRQLNRTYNSLKTRARVLESGKENKRSVKWSKAEVEQIQTLGPNPTTSDFERLAVKLDRSVKSLKYKLLDTKPKVKLQPEPVYIKKSISIPTNDPVWFERRLTKAQLMAGR